MQPPLPDQKARDRFEQEVIRNFSVMASAGAGKTTAIIKRIVQLAKADQGNPDPVLPRLVVVTYTRKAALEMQDRARRALIEANCSPAIMALLRKAFFGTIHSFCHDIIRQHAFTFGITSALEMGESNDNLWQEFMQEAVRPMTVDELLWKGILRHVRFSDLLSLAKNIPVEPLAAPPPGNQPPVIDGGYLLSFKPSTRNLANVTEGQRIFRSWLERYQSGSGFVALPEFTKGGKDFQDAWKHTLAPLYEWLNRATTVAAQALARTFRNYRLSRGSADFEDLLDLAAQLIRDPEQGRKLRERRLVILLDEAQDTDPRQFLILTELARAATVEDIWLENGILPPEPGRFSMVGDPQQSIYSDRADNEYYLNVHSRLTDLQAGEALLFNVTMRCASAIVNGVNQAFPHLFNEHQGSNRAPYNPLVSKPKVESGKLLKLHFEPSGDSDNGVAAQQSARALAEWMRGKRPEHFQATHWSEVAILCPRNNWLDLLARELRRVNLATHVWSVSSIRGDDPVYAWVAGLFAVLANPVDSFELVGVLREIFGISDHELATYVQTRRTEGVWHPLHLLHPTDDPGPVGSVLNLLHELRTEILTLPLHSAVERAIQSTQIRERIEVLGLMEKESIAERLDAIRAQSITAEMDRQTLSEFATTLRQDFSIKYEPATPPRDAIALLSCQKAKGLEWQAVIIPYFGHSIGYRMDDYPRYYHNYGRNPPKVFIKGSDEESFKDRKSLKLHEELDRILYVAMTRAKKLLILADDRSFYKVPSEKKQTFAKRLQIDSGEANHGWWSSLDTEMPLPMDRKLDSADLWPEFACEEVMEVPFDVIVDRALTVQQSHWNRIIPSSLAHHDETTPVEELEAMQPGDFPEELGVMDPMVYGTWYHGVMEHLPWAEGVESCRSHVMALIEKNPEIERGAKELPVFLESELARVLCSGEWIICTEVPLFWSSGEHRVVEGIIDLLARRVDDSALMVVDWKTDRIKSADPASDLLECYSPQIQLYADALSSIYGKPVKAFIYSTVLAQTLGVGA